LSAWRLAAHCAELKADVREQAPVTAARVTAIADELVRVREACRVERQGMLA
jgi:hypothetical protein